MKQTEFDELRKDVSAVQKDVAYIRGMMSQKTASDKDWLARIGLAFMVVWSLFRAKIGGA